MLSALLGSCKPEAPIKAGVGDGYWLTGPVSIASRNPAANALDVVKTSNIEVQFSTSINGTTVNQNTFNVDGRISGEVAGSYSGGGSTITFNPTSDFNAGETVTVTLTTGIKGENGTTLAIPVTWQFVVDAPQGSALFTDSGQSLGSSYSNSVSLGDLAGDGDLDAFVANYSPYLSPRTMSLISITPSGTGFGYGYGGY